MMDNLIPVGASSVLGAIKRSCPWAEIRLFDTTFYRTEASASDRDRSDLLQVMPVDYASRGLSIKEENVFEDFRRTVKDFKPDIILLSAVEVTFGQGAALLRAIEDIKPFVIAGGVFAILAPEDVIKEKLIDAVCTAEGEDSVPEFLTKFRKQKDFYGIPGMWFRKGGKIIKLR